MKTVAVLFVLVVVAGLGALGGYKLNGYLPIAQGATLGWNSPPTDRSTAPAAPIADFRQAVRQIMPSVVSVDRLERIQNFWTDEVSVTPTASGSGVIVAKDGYILTNNHVVEDAAQVVVHLDDGRQFPAKVVGTDPRSDIAVLKIEAPNLRAAELGSSAGLAIGEWVIAVGNPLGYANTVSVGVVSSLKRTLATNESGLLIDAIQTDAAINQGNSGGALTNARGQVVGINSAMASTTGGNIGIGFAIPIDRARRVADDIVRYGRARYGSLGVEVFGRPGLLQVDSVRQELAQRLGAEPPRQGVIVRRVTAGSVAQSTGIQPLDILESIDGKALTEPMGFQVAMADRTPGSTIKLRYWSKGKSREVEIALTEQQ